jgi:hypothetical protein
MSTKQDVLSALETAIEHWEAGDEKLARKYVEWALKALKAEADERAERTRRRDQETA